MLDHKESDEMLFKRKLAIVLVTTIAILVPMLFL